MEHTPQMIVRARPQLSDAVRVPHCFCSRAQSCASDSARQQRPELLHVGVGATHTPQFGAVRSMPQLSLA